ncbi:hypothetical protein WICPIJ_005914 [Wickerhamomyces pijperi]|uniref:Pru domain-containing protein n=1 Tax=Wickerhamomyces pijperi TaxID=599730 RepID=A0A9P8Q4R2_WICPI|nr:hypothetical protein WICPIJ_005914 [Wickerhamomyces pijperi]
MSTVRFRAGRVSYDPETKIATPDPIQGQITIKPSEEDESFYSFEWVPKEAAVNVEKEELLVIPGDVQWKHIPNAKDGRVFELSFLSSSARHLFWLQDINEFDDDDKLDQLSEKDKATFAKIQKIFEPVEEQEDEEQMEESVPEVAAEPTLQA